MRIQVFFIKDDIINLYAINRIQLIRDRERERQAIII